MHGRLYYLSLPHATDKREFRRRGDVWVQREKERVADEKRGKRVEEALNQETERSWHKDKKHSIGAPRKVLTCQLRSKECWLVEAQSLDLRTAAKNIPKHAAGNETGWPDKVVIVALSPSCAEDRPGDIHNHQNLQTLAFGLPSCPLFVLAKQSQH
ncbi:unnamed protein product [Pleuronectes platessa]|uniref:Uncharacterized protein n=1 Tax=Pleuronectes platessa TaxID=8262 RepID=A0A9N7UTN8_PLEPL|nr:unnamed protein product [Pleuronectes platessa]